MTVVDRIRRIARRDPIVPVVRLSGFIGSAGGLRSGLTLQSVSKQLSRAFGVKSAPAVAIVVNSPGGAPVQARLIFQRIRALAAEKKKPVLVFVEDLAASGGYMMALAGDEIIADPNSIVGSIGVVTAGFGFSDLIEKIGIDRRIYTAGRQKAMLDPFQPEKSEDVEHLKELQAEIHENFIAMVRDRRPGLAEDEDLFTGAFWTGARAKAYGLVDHLGELRTVLRERFGKKVRLKVFGERKGLIQRWAGTDRGGLRPEALGAMIDMLEEHAQWKRFGL